ncbi:hypothetical protein CV044_03450 [Achromobacter ruhlandii]|nr:hypothetical protein CV044_03450 [Achromobacter ruhlandii]
MPQSSENGSRIDWYAPGPGTVIPWNAATAGEQAAALERLESVRAGVAQLRDAVLAKGGGNDAALLGRLLKWVMHHPDPSYVFLVAGQPVITFWGFVHSGADRSADPLHTLHPGSSAALSPAPVIETATATGLNTMAAAIRPAVAVTPWWKRWWLWLALLLALLALLFGLRACMPTLMPGIPRADLPRDLALPNANVSTPALPGAGASGVSPFSGDATAGKTPEAASQPAAAAGIAPASQPAAAPDAHAPAAPGDSTTTPPPSAPAAEPGKPAAPPQPETKDALQIPPNAADGNADFLNGNWRAGAGIQDRDTGEPLRLHYQFKNGEGQVTLNRHNGVQCVAPVSAAMNKGSLSISNSVEAKCSDGGTFNMPLVQCKPAANNIAACDGNYGNERFPMAMSRAQP